MICPDRIFLPRWGEEPVAVRADQGLIKQVLRILMDNAVKYSPSGSRIYLRLSAQEGYARLTVQDEGGGIPPESIPHIFERFYRADQMCIRDRRRRGDGGGEKGQLLLAGEALQGGLPAQGLAAVLRRFQVDQGHRAAGAGVLGPLPGVVLLKAALGVVGAAGVQGVIGAAQQIDVPHQPASGSAGARGSRKEMRVPTSCRETTSNHPSWRSTIHRAMDSPRPCLLYTSNMT